MIRYILLGGIVMIPIGIVSVIALTLVLEKLVVLMKFRKPASSFLASIFDAIRKQEWELALMRCRNSRHPLARILEAGLSEITKEESDLRTIEEAMKLKGDEIVHQLERSLKFLGALITILPLLGFLGTIVGLIVAFEKWEVLGASVTISELSGGMYQAMITTAAGLILTVPYYLAHGYLTARIETITLQLSNYATEFLSRLRLASWQSDSSVYALAEKYAPKIQNR